jgi:ABC-type metal ion transport system substrate-binding protein
MLEEILITLKSRQGKPLETVNKTKENQKLLKLKELLLSKLATIEN